MPYGEVAPGVGGGTRVVGCDLGQVRVTGENVCAHAWGEMYYNMAC